MQRLSRVTNTTSTAAVVRTKVFVAQKTSVYNASGKPTAQSHRYSRHSSVHMWGGLYRRTNRCGKAERVEVRRASSLGGCNVAMLVAMLQCCAGQRAMDCPHHH